MKNSRKSAIKAGDVHYFTGKECRNGHVAIRYAKSGVCSKCSLEHHRLPRNMQRNRQSARRWAKENPIATRKRIMAWCQQNPERVRSYQKAWKDRNPEKAAAINRAAAARQRKEDPSKRAAWQALRDSRKIRATPPWAELDKIRSFYEACPPDHHVDHIIPLRNPYVCGLHVLSNLQYLPANENLKKRNKFDIERNWR